MNPETGAIGDPRGQEEKEKDFLHEELATAIPIEFKEKTEWKSYPARSQTYTLECVAYSTTKHLAINNIPEFGEYKELDPDFFYYYRFNKPGGGMAWEDSMKIATKKGAPKVSRPLRKRESDPELEPTVEMVKEALDAVGKSFIRLQNITMQSVAQAIETQGSCLLWFWFDEKGTEWWREQPVIKFASLGTYDEGATRHAVIATDYGILDDKEVILIEDSAGNKSALEGQNRFIDKKFLNRCFIAGYVIDSKILDYTQPIRPKFTFTRVLKVGSTGHDVKALQKILVYEDCMTIKEPTEYFGGMTRAGVVKLQEKYTGEILKPLGLSKGTGLVGKATITWLNKKYG